MALLQFPAFAKQRPWVRTAVLRPELGSLVAAALLFIFFSIASSGAMVEIPTIARVLDTAWPYGIIAVAVGLLMISGEFDLSAGVMVGTAGALLGVMATEWGMNLWLALLLSLGVCLALGLWNGVLVVWTGLPSFVITLGTFFGLRGANVALSKYFTGDALIENIDEAAGYESLHAIVATVFGTAPSDFRVSLLWWGGFTAHRHLDPLAHEDWQLDFRHGRRQRSGAGSRRSGQRHENRAVYVDRRGRLVCWG